MTDLDLLGPVHFLAVEFPGGGMTGAGFRLLRGLVDRGVVSVLDLEFMVKDADGTISRVALEDVPQQEPVDVTAWAGLRSGILDAEDLAAVGAAISPGSLAGILVYEVVWAAPIMQEITDSGARLLGGGRVDEGDLLAALGISYDDDGAIAGAPAGGQH